MKRKDFSKLVSFQERTLETGFIEVVATVKFQCNGIMDPVYDMTPARLAEFKHLMADQCYHHIWGQYRIPLLEKLHSFFKKAQPISYCPDEEILSYHKLQEEILNLVSNQ